MPSSDPVTQVEETMNAGPPEKEGFRSLLPAVLLGIVYLGAFCVVILPFFLPFEQVQTHTFSPGVVLLVVALLSVMIGAGFLRIFLLDTTPSDKYITGGIFLLFSFTATVQFYSILVLGEVGFWLMALFCMTVLGIVLGVRYSHRKTKKGLLSGESALVHWTYSDEEWRGYALSGLGAIQNPKTPAVQHEIIVGDDGILKDGKLTAWNTYGMSLYEIDVVPSPVPGLTFTHRTSGGYVPVYHSLFVPVPGGHLEEAKGLITHFWNRGVKIEDPAGILAPGQYGDPGIL